MSRQSDRNERAPLPKSPLLITESADEFDSVLKALKQEIKPRDIIEDTYRDIIEDTYVDQFAEIVWEIRRLRRCKTVIINTAFGAALKDLLEQFSKAPGLLSLPTFEHETLVRRWFIDPKARKEVTELLRKFQLDECAIEAEAIRRSLPALEPLDKMLASLEARRDKTLRRIAEYRDGIAQQLRESSKRMIEGKGVLRLEDASGKKSAAA